MTTAPHWDLRRRDFHPQVQQIASLHLPRTPTPFAAACFSRRRSGLTTNGLHLSLPLELSKGPGPPHVAVLDTIDHKIDFHIRKHSVLSALFKALLLRMMTGRIRVTNHRTPGPLVDETGQAHTTETETEEPTVIHHSMRVPVLHDEE